MVDGTELGLDLLIFAFRGEMGHLLALQILELIFRGGSRSRLDRLLVHIHEFLIVRVGPFTLSQEAGAFFVRFCMSRKISFYLVAEPRLVYFVHLRHMIGLHG